VDDVFGNLFELRGGGADSGSHGPARSPR
jgi:hypothetical protein